ncbi:myb/SANT-like DNA-binding domain-containing protein 3 isoform X1 [Nilaparvata lugens]|uniref:myb/SANT-like DNA-binding domain-containing protein 3 isoform X1 n=1 Tax=Nilaparvata lugens TaxID=108931 RepID=UPI00193CD095|nr:myb/SANT-like DNA-binding domain-containing protein 3 isoform X1 [Nilaparvata lugens]
MAESKKRINFTKVELTLIKSLVVSRPIIEKKLHDQKTENLRKIAWEEILIEFNAAGLNCKRNVEQLKGAWKRIKNDYKSQKSEERRSRFRTGGGPPSPPKVEDPEMEELFKDQVPIENIPDDDDDFNDYNSDHDGTEVLEGTRSASPKPDTPIAGTSTAPDSRATTPGSATGSAQPRIKRVSSNADKFHKKKMEYLEEEHKLRLTVINEEHRAKMEAIEKEKKYWTLMEANAQKQISFQRENSHSSIEQKTFELLSGSIEHN